MEYILEKFHRNVMTAPDAPFLYDETYPDGITFAQFDILSARVYSWLKKQGIGREDFVLINLPRGLTVFAAAAGVWKAGAAFVIVEESYASGRTALIRKDCGCRAEIDRTAMEEIMREEPLSGWERTDPHDAAFAIYTSGTTGTPKGVLHEYGNIDRCLQSMQLEGNPMLGSGIFRPYTSPMTFVAAVIGLTAMMAADHARMYIVPYSVAKDPEKLVQLYEKHRFNMAFLSPSYARILGPMLVPYLKTLVVASEPAGNLFFPGIRLLNFYGGSESYFLVATFRIGQRYEKAPVGKPAFPLDIRLVDEEGKDVPEGEAGELVYDNPYFRGYIHLPEETASALKDGYFHSGDMARRDEEGNLIILGRAGEMFKINGNRVEPGEIESVAKRILGIEWAAVRFFPGAGAGGSICLYYRDEIGLKGPEIQRKMAEYLPYYMIPTMFCRVEEIPLLPNGKMNRRGLPEPDRMAGRPAYKAPKNEIEAVLCRAFEKVLGAEHVGTADDYYELGGDSLRSIQMAVACGLPGLDAGMVFRGRTPEKIAAIYAAEHSEEDETVREERNRTALSQPHPLSTEQIYMLDIQLYTANSTMYNLACLLKTGKEMDADRLAEAAGQAIRAHPALLTIIQFRRGQEIAQRYAPELFEEIRAEKISEQELAQLKDTLVQPYKSMEEKLYRCRVFETEEAVYLFLDIHHIIFDGTSMRILMQDIDRILRGEKTGEDWYYLLLTEREKERAGDFYRQSREYFEQRYLGTAWSTHPKTDHSTRKNEADEIILPLQIPMETLVQAETALHLSRNELMIAAAILAIGAYNQENDILISWIYHGRNNILYSRTVGLLFRDLPVGIHLDRINGISDLVFEVQEQVRGGMEHDCFPYTEAGFSGMKGMNTCLLYQRHLYDKIRIGGMDMVPIGLRQNLDASQTILDIEVIEKEEKLSLLLDYAASLYDRESILRFGAIMEEAIGAITEQDPGRRDGKFRRLLKRDAEQKEGGGEKT